MQSTRVAEPRVAATSPPGTSGSPDVSTPGVFRAALWFAALAWIGESAILSVQYFAFDRLRVWSPVNLWLSALAYPAVFLIAALPFALRRRSPQSHRRLRLLLFVLVLLAATSIALVFVRLHTLACIALGAGVAVQLSRWLTRHAAGFARLVRRTVPLMVTVMALIAGTAAAHPWASERWALARLPAPRPQAPNVIIIILDTVRAASMSLYGAARSTTPELEQFAQRAVTFDRAISTAPWTLPAHLSLFSGILPASMGQPIDQFGRTASARAWPSLPETFAANGYATAAFVGNLFYLSQEFGLDRGFLRYEDRPASFGQLVLSTAPGRRLTNNGRFRRLIGYHQILNRKPAARINRDFLDWLSHRRDRPFLAFLNYYDAHEPYLPPPEFAARFTKRPIDIGYFYDTDRVQRLQMDDVPPRETTAQRDLYEASIAALDAQIGALLDSLERRDLLDNTLIVISADHGEEFMEHGRMGHTKHVYMQLLHVPLLIAYPGRVPAGKRVRSPVSLADVPATVMELAGARPKDGEAFPGRSLARSWQDPLAAFGPIVSEANPGHNRKSIIDWPFHLIRNMNGSLELYDVAADPEEHHNLAGRPDLTRLADRLNAALENVLRNNRPR